MERGFSYRFGMVIALVLGVVTGVLLWRLFGHPPTFWTYLVGFLLGGVWWALIRPFIVMLQYRSLERQLSSVGTSANAVGGRRRPQAAFDEFEERLAQLEEAGDVSDLLDLAESTRDVAEARACAAAIAASGEDVLPVLVAELRHPNRRAKLAGIALAGVGRPGLDAVLELTAQPDIDDDVLGACLHGLRAFALDNDEGDAWREVHRLEQEAPTQRSRDMAHVCSMEMDDWVMRNIMKERGLR